MYFRQYRPIRATFLLTCALLMAACSEGGDHDNGYIHDPWSVSTAQYPQLAAPMLDTRLVDTGFTAPDDVAFNPGMTRWKDQLWMALRVDRYNASAQPGCDVERTLVLAQLDEHLQLQPERFSIELPHPGQACATVEDARLVADGDHLYVIYNARSLTDDETPGVRPEDFTTWVRRIFLAELSLEGAPRALYARQLESPSYPLAKVEKNWTPFVSEAGLHLIYAADPSVVFLISRDVLSQLRASQHAADTLDLDPPTVSLADPQPEDMYGPRRGGTQAIFEPALGRYVTFSHSVAPAGTRGQRLYFMGFYTFDSNAPFDVASYLPQPLDIPCVSPERHEFHKVVFPGGVIDLGETYAVAFGHDDISVGMSLVDKARLFRELVPAVQTQLPAFPQESSQQ